MLLHCFAGCGGADVVAALGLEFRDLFPEALPANYSAPKTRKLTRRELQSGIHQSISILLRYGRLVADCGALTDAEASQAEASARRIEYLFDEWGAA